MSAINRGSSTDPLRPAASPQQASTPPSASSPLPGPLVGDSLQLQGPPADRAAHAGARPTHGASSDRTVAQAAGEQIDHLAHSTHTPHGVLHVVETGERAAHVVGRVVRQAGRAASIAAEVEGEVHHATGHGGPLGRLAGALDRAVGRAGELLEAGLRAVPGVGRLLDGARGAGQAAGAALDSAVAGTRLAGAGGRLTGQMGGRLPVVGAVIGGVIAVADVRGAIRVFSDPHATPRDRAISGTQATLSAVSGAAGAAALGAAAAIAVGVTAPVSIPLMLGASAVAGAGAFALSFFTPRSHG